MISKGYVSVFVDVLYYLPDQPSLLNEFLWETLDIKPKFPRVRKFLDFWERKIDGRIKQVTIADRPPLRPGKWSNKIILPL